MITKLQGEDVKLSISIEGYGFCMIEGISIYAYERMGHGESMRRA